MAEQQRRGRSIAMTPDELDVFLGQERTCRVATITANGVHNTPLWFAWDGSALWLTSIVRSQRWTDIQRDPRVAVIVDAGKHYSELRGVELTGSVEVVGDAPRPVDAAPDERLAEAERLFGDRYANGRFADDGRHGWLRLVPDKVVSWDFRKSRQRLPAGSAETVRSVVVTVTTPTDEFLGTTDGPFEEDRDDAPRSWAAVRRRLDRELSGDDS